MRKFIVLKICNQRSYYYIRVNDEKIIGNLWLNLSKYGYFKLECFYRFDMDNHDSKTMFESCISNSYLYYDSFESFVKNRKRTISSS